MTDKIPPIFAALLFGLFLVSGLHAQPQTKTLLKPCQVPGVDSEVLCGNYEVFENRETKKGRKIALNIVVLPARSPNPQPDPLFVLVGGPGQAATDGAGGDIRRFSALLEDRDVVLIDQRGTGKSNGLTCDFGGIKGVFEAFVAGRFSPEKVRECRSRLGETADLRFYSTPVAMDDLDEVRNWLGYDKINLYGGSYGTRPALVYLRRHPEHVRTVTVRGVYSMNPFYFARDTGRSLDLLLADCAKDTECAKAYPDLKKDLEQLLKKLDKSPGTVVIPENQTGKLLEIEITPEAFLGGIRRLLYDSETQRRIPLMIKKGAAGNFQPFEDILQQTSGILNGFSIGMFFSVACPEGIQEMNPEKIENAFPDSLFRGFMAKTAAEACREWKLEPLPAEYFAPIRSDKPVLILSGELDPVTPPVWGDDAGKSLPNSLHLKMEGIAHSPFPSCALGIMTDFVKTGSTANLDTVCLKDLRRPPFVLPASVLPAELDSFGKPEAAIVRLEHRWLELIAGGDRQGLVGFMPDEFMQNDIRREKPVTAGKSEWIERVLQLTTQLENGVYNLEKPEVKIEGDTATVDLGWTLSGKINSRSLTDTIRITDVWKRTADGDWKVVSRVLRNQ